MLYKPVALMAAFAMASNAFMIPSTFFPDLTATDNNAAPPMHEDMDNSRTVMLPCRECSFPGKDGADADVHDNLVVFRFSFSEDRKLLLLNDAPFFPIKASLSSPFTAVQVPHIPGRHHALSEYSDGLQSRPRKLFYVAGARAVAAADGSDAQLIDMNFEVTALDEERVSLSPMAIRMLRNEAGVLSLTDLIVLPRDLPTLSLDLSDLPAPVVVRPHIEASAPVSAPATIAEACGSGPASLVCRWRALLSEKLQDMRKPGCSGLKKNIALGMPRVHGGPSKFEHHGPPPADAPALAADTEVDSFADAPAADDSVTQPPSQPWRHDGHHHHGHGHHGHGHHGHHHRGHHGGMHRVAHFAHAFVLGIVIPVLVGVVCGIMASTLGMVVGTLIGWLWIKLVRGGKRGNASSTQEAVVVGDEKMKLLEVEAEHEEQEEEEGLKEALPVYVEPPVYEEME